MRSPFCLVQRVPPNNFWTNSWNFMKFSYGDHENESDFHVILSNHSNIADTQTSAVDTKLVPVNVGS
jgi:hypothetical protein